MEQDGTLNGAAAFIVYKIGRLEVIAESNQKDISGLTKRLDILERSKLKSIKQKAGDIAPYLTGLVVLGLAMGGEWEKLGKFLHGFVR